MYIPMLRLRRKPTVAELLPRVDVFTNALLKGRWDNCVLGDTDTYIKAVIVTLGEPGPCLLCGKVWDRRKKPTDLCAWFCSACCPVCAE